jgi:hypothetical protein
LRGCRARSWRSAWHGASYGAEVGLVAGAWGREAGELAPEHELGELLGHAALGAGFDGVVEAPEVVLADRAMDPGDRASWKRGDVEADDDDESGVGIEQDLEHGQVDAAVRPEAELVVEQGDEDEADEPRDDHREGYPLPTPLGGGEPHNDRVENEGEHARESIRRAGWVGWSDLPAQPEFVAAGAA